MKYFKKFLLVLLLFIVFPRLFVSGEDVTQPVDSASESETDRLPGVAFTEGLSQITGVAISPLWGVSCIGAWNYYDTPETQREELPLFCHPFFWGSMFTLLGICLLKDVFGIVVPLIPKKMFDQLELLETNLSGAVAGFVFVPWLTMQIGDVGDLPVSPSAPSIDSASASIASGNLSFASFDPSFLYTPLAVISFFVVWLLSHSINGLIAICPSKIGDTALKAIKGFVLGTFWFCYWIHPLIAAILSVIIILIAFKVAGWSFRLMFYSLRFGSEIPLSFVFPDRTKRKATPSTPQVFVSHDEDGGLFKRTYGHLFLSEDGKIYFSYRPWLVLPRRMAEVRFAEGEYSLSKGFLYPSLNVSYDLPDDDLSASDRSQTAERRRDVRVFDFLPRYRGLEREVGENLKIREIEDGKMKAFLGWLKSVVFGHSIPRDSFVIKKTASG
jgi:hypothetical protein